MLPFPEESQLRQNRATQSMVHAGCFSVSIIHRTDKDYGIFKVSTYVSARDCTRGCTDTVRESALKVENPLPHRGIEPASKACLSDALPTELHSLPSDILSTTQGSLKTIA